MNKARREFRLILPLLALLFVVLAFLAAGLIVGEARRAQILVEYEADRTASGLVEAYRSLALAPLSSRSDELPTLDPRILGFGLFRADGSLVVGFGDAPASLEPKDLNTPFRYDQARRTVSLVRLLGQVGMRGPAMRDMMRRALPGQSEQPGQALRGAGRYFYLSMDIRDFYRRRSFYRAASFLAPLVVLALAGVFISLLLSNLRYRRAAEERETLARLGESARTLAHEIRNPLSAIRLQSGLLRRKLPEGRSGELDAIDEETERLSGLTRRVSDFLKNPSGRPERVELGEFLGELAGRSAYPFSLEAPPPGLAARIDRELLRSVLENLVRNAYESYDGAEGEVTVSLSRQGSRALVVVGDRGKGIAPEAMAKVFDPFYTDKPQGSGIGLPLSRRFVEAAGGSLTLSPRKGGGTEARVSLPIEGA